MTRSIDRDVKRFDEILRGRLRKDLKKYINHTEMLGKRGRETVSIPVAGIDIPQFQHGPKGNGGTGQGDGNLGEPLGGVPGETAGQGQAGNEPGQHLREVELTFDELATMLGEELELPAILPKGRDSIHTQKSRFNTISRNGPSSLRHFKRTFKTALKRQISAGEYHPLQPKIIPIREDERFRASKTVHEPQANAAICYLMDVSGSMTDDQKEIVRTQAFWIDTWLSKNYHGIQKRYIVHDAVAHEVDEKTFYSIKESGGTRISSAYLKAGEIIKRDFPVSDWNIYCFHFSDGDNWGEDSQESLRILSEELLPVLNLCCYGQVQSQYGSGDFIKSLRKIVTQHENLILSEIPNRDAIYGSIKTFLGKGK